MRFHEYIRNNDSKWTKVNMTQNSVLGFTETLGDSPHLTFFWKGYTILECHS